MRLVVSVEIFLRTPSILKLVVDFSSGIFAANYIAALDGVTVIPGGWLNHNWIQVVYQLCDSVTGFTYSFGVTCLILYIMNWIPGLSLRASEEAEIDGIDEAEIGELAYDFVEKQGDYVATPKGNDDRITSSCSSYNTSDTENILHD